MTRPRLRAPAAHLASGALFGLAFVHPALWWCAWLAIAALAAALTWTRSSLAAFGWVFLAQALARAIAFPWVPEMNRITFGYTGADAFWLLVGEWLIWSLPHAVALALAHRALRGRALVCLWLPAAWALAELARFHILSLALDDWLATQWTVGPVLRALGHLGWYPTLLACLVAAASLGEAVTTYLPRVALPALLVPAALLAMPPLAPHTDRLAGVLAVHTDSLAALPHTPPPGAARLVVWPEGALETGPLLAEGVTRGARVRPPLPGSPATHVVGALSQRPFGGRQNQVLIVAADGAVAASRAKSLLFPIGERRILGIGADAFVPGRVAPALDAGGVSVIPLICGEVMSRALVRRGVDAGGQLLVVPSRDQMMVGDRPLRQLLAIQVLRSVELGVPSARGSYGGAANLVAADGAVLAVSGRDRSGFLSWDPVGGPRDVDFWGDPITPGAPPPPRPRPDVVVLYERAASALRTRCPDGRCAYHALDDLRCPEDAHAGTVIVAGHGAPPTYLSRSAADVAAAVRCFRPALVVLDVCYGASAELVGALADLDAVVVAAPSLLPGAGFDYGADFFTAADPAARAAAVRLPGATRPLLRGPVTRATVAAALAAVADMDGDALRRHLARRVPPAVEVELPGAGPLLVPVDWARVRSAPARAAAPPRRASRSR